MRTTAPKKKHHDDPRTEAIFGAAIEVHGQLHRGLAETVYQDALVLEFVNRRIPFEREKPLKVFYKGTALQSFFKADFVCFGSILLECRAKPALQSDDDAEVLNFLCLTGLERAVLMNFGSPTPEFRLHLLPDDLKPFLLPS